MERDTSTRSNAMGEITFGVLAAAAEAMAAFSADPSCAAVALCLEDEKVHCAHSARAAVRATATQHRAPVLSGSTLPERQAKDSTVLFFRPLTSRTRTPPPLVFLSSSFSHGPHPSWSP